MFMQDEKKKMKPDMKKSISALKDAGGESAFAPKNSRGLPGNIRAGIESLSGFSMENVTVHYNSSKPSRLNAHAYTKGTEIHVAPGEEKHLPHEAWHVVQQMQGRVTPTGRIAGEMVNDSRVLEREADIMGAKAVRAGSVPNPPLQKKSCGKVAQLSHIKNVSPNTQPAPQLIQNAKPTIVFESMADNAASAQSIFDQTKGYSGNTICVFGLNRRVGLAGAALGPVQIGDVYRHFFRGFTFEWEKPGQVLETDQYKMPFIEARAEIMGQAEKIVGALPANSIQPNPPEHAPAKDNSHDIVYRWIDGDAKDDTSQKVPAGHLAALANETMGVLSGPYKWRSESERVAHSHTFYHQFIDRVNECESRVREEYFKRKGKLAADMGSATSLPEYLKANNGLNGYYLPETTLMMSSNTHDAILKNVRSKQAASEIYPVIGNRALLMQVLGQYANVNLENQLKTHMNNVRADNFPASAQPLKQYIEHEYAKDKNGFDGESMQDKESMKMLLYANVGRNSVYYEPKLSVTKPLKGDNGQGGTNYLGDELFRLLRDAAYVDEEVFNQYLVKMRQSVFDKFSISEADSPGYRDFLNAEKHKIYLCYVSLRQRISDELNV